MLTKEERLKIAMETLLDIPTIEIKEVLEDRNGNYIVTVTGTQDGTHCHHCGKWIDSAWRKTRHIETHGEKYSSWKQ